MRKKNQRILLSKNDTWVRPYFKKYWKLLVLVLFLGILTFFCGSALMFTSGFLISKSATRPWNVLAVYVPIVLTRGFGIGRPAFRYAERLGSHNWVLKMTSDIRLKLYNALESKAVKSKSEFQTGNVLGILAEDIEHIQNLYLRSIFPAMIGLLLYGIIVIALGVFSVGFALWIALILGVMIILLPLVSILINQGRIYKRKQVRHELYNQLTDSILGVGDWQYSGRYEDFITHYDKTENQVQELNESINQYNRKQETITQFLLAVAIASLLLWAGSYFGRTPGRNWIASFALAAFPLIDAFVPIAGGVMEWPMYEDSTKRLHHLPQPIPNSGQFTRLDAEKLTNQMTAQQKGKIDKKTKLDHFSSIKQKDDISKTLDNSEISIEFKKVSYHYPTSNKLILKNLNLKISHGTTLALLGKSGTGKTTLSKILRGDLEPTHGSVELNQISVSQLTDEMSQYIGVLNQAPHLFNTTILNNVRLGNVHASDEEVMTAIHQAGLDPVLAKLPQGAETYVEEGGRRFSGGEQQRIALARILLQKVPIVIIDEPTIGLDPLTEHDLLDTVFDVLTDKTILWITHHLVGIEHADEVIFLEDGDIQMQGTSETLYKQEARYRRLYELDY